jgi:hypothetical protein
MNSKLFDADVRNRGIVRKTNRLNPRFSADKVCGRFSRRKAGLVLKKLDRDTILIEGNRSGLEFLGNLFLAQARCDDCGFQLGPKGPGNPFFKKKSTFGLYIHRFCGKSAK